MTAALWRHDTQQCRNRPGLIGVDEAGRGALAGPVVAGAVYLPGDFFKRRGRKRAVASITDSKALNAGQREAAYEQIREWIHEGAIRGGTGSASVEEIEALNILGATRLAMIRALEVLLGPDHEALYLELNSEEPLFEQTSLNGCGGDAAPVVLLDGRPMRPFPYAHRGVVGGDGKSLAIAMGSILAKVTRDRALAGLADHHPDYGFHENKGYGTVKHREALLRAGPCRQHRPTFLRKILGGEAHRTQPFFDFDSSR